MNVFYCVCNSVATDSTNLRERVQCLEDACKIHGIDFVVLDEPLVDFSRLPVPDVGDALYNCARGSRLLESVMINEHVRTFYRRYPSNALHANTNQICIELGKQGIQTPRTIHKGSSDRARLKQYVEHVGGFPVVLKVYGLTRGVGVMLFHDFMTMQGVVEYLDRQNVDYCLKEHIPSDTCERVTVVGNEALFCNTRPVREGDFRSSAYDREARPIKVSEAVGKLAVAATHAANLNYAGVDIVVDTRTGRPYVIEVNCPQNFVAHQRISGENYAEKMVAWLFCAQA